MDLLKNFVDILESHTSRHLGQSLKETEFPGAIFDINNNEEYIKFLQKTAETLFHKCHYESAIRFYEKLLDQQKNKSIEKIMHIYNRLMRCYTEEGRFDDVEKIFKLISQLNFPQIPLEDIFVSFYELAISYHRRGEFKTALLVVDNAIKGYDSGEISRIRELEDKCHAIISKLFLLKTDILFSINDYVGCSKYAQLLIELDKDKKLFSYISFLQGKMASNQGRMLDALKAYRNVINHEKQANKKGTGPLTSQIYLHISRLFYLIGKYQASKKYFYKYITQTRYGRSTISNMLLSSLIASYNFQEGDFGEAEALFSKLLNTSLNKKTKYLSLMASMGLFNLQAISNRLHEARTILENSYQFLHGANEQLGRQKLELEWARLFNLEGDTHKALEVAKEAIKYFTKQQRFKELTKLYGIITRSCIQQKDYMQAMKYVSQQEALATQNYLKLDLLEAKLYKFIICKALQKEEQSKNLGREISVLLAKKVGGVAYAVIYSKLQGFLQDHAVFLRKNQHLIVRSFLLGFGSKYYDEEDHDIILDYKRKTIFERHLGEIYMGNKGLLLRILLVLIEKKGQTILKEELYEKVWKDLYNPLKHDNLIYININRLRKLIEPNPQKNQYVLNTAGGYMFNDAATFLIKSVNLDESLSKRQNEILDFIRKNRKITVREYKDRFGISKSSAVRDLKRLKDLQLISEHKLGNKSVFSVSEMMLKEKE